MYTIGELAKKAEVNAQTIRFYERQGILRPEGRKQSGYRVYSDDSFKRLVFIRQAKELGFSLKEIKELLNMRAKTKSSCDRVRSKASIKRDEIREKIKQLKRLDKTLTQLIHDCENRVVSECCPIIEKMEPIK